MGAPWPRALRPGVGGRGLCAGEGGAVEFQLLGVAHGMRGGVGSTVGHVVKKDELTSTGPDEQVDVSLHEPVLAGFQSNRPLVLKASPRIGVLQMLLKPPVDLKPNRSIAPWQVAVNVALRSSGKLARVTCGRRGGSGGHVCALHAASLPEAGSIYPGR